MVKPPKTMQPEYRMKPPPGRSQQRYASTNTFHDYMARKIQLQRQQMGTVGDGSSNNGGASSATDTTTLNGLRLPPKRPRPVMTSPSVTTATTPQHHQSQHQSHYSPSSSIRSLPSGDSRMVSSRKRPRDDGRSQHDSTTSRTPTTSTGIVSSSSSFSTIPISSLSFYPTSKITTTKSTTDTIPTWDNSVSNVPSILQRLVQKHGAGKSKIQRKVKKQQERDLKQQQQQDNDGENDTMIGEIGDELVSTAAPSKSIDVRYDNDQKSIQGKDDYNEQVVLTGGISTAVLPFDTAEMGGEEHEREHEKISESFEDEEQLPQQLPQEKDDDDHRRPDLFFLGIVIKVNGYTDPDSESLKRLIQKYGGDFETYETSRVTHIVAETLSKAKADSYVVSSSSSLSSSSARRTSISTKRPRLKLPIVQPQWILDSIQQQRLLPWDDYICLAVKDHLQPTNQRGIQDMFRIIHPTKAIPDSRSKAETTTTTTTTPTTRTPTETMPTSLPPSSSSSIVAHKSLSTVEKDLHTLPTRTSDLSKGRSSYPLLTQQELTEDTRISMETTTKTTSTTTMIDAVLNRSKAADSTTALPYEHDHDENPITVIESNHKNLHQEPSISTERTAPDGESSTSSVADRLNEENDKISHPYDALNDTTIATDTTSTIQDGPHGLSSPTGRTDSKYIGGRIRTTGTDPNFLESFFANSRLSFIGSYQQRTTTTASGQVATPHDISTAFPQFFPLCGDGTSGGGTTKHQAFVYHVDMDCFFANVVLRKYPQYRDQPVVICHYGKKSHDREDNPSRMGPTIKSSSSSSIPSSSTSECATCNYHARSFGIEKGMFLGRAKQLCPDLIILPYDFDGYEEVSEQVLSILHRVAAEFDGCVEAVSCDEAYLQILLPVSTVDHVNTCSIIDNTNERTTVSSDDCAGRIAEAIRMEIVETTQCTASIGVAANKFLAKIGTDRVKPNGTFVVRDYRSVLESLRLRDLHGIGYRSEPKLATEGLDTVQDVWDLGSNAEFILSRILGPGLGKKIYQFCLGRDDREVKAAERKTIGAECNYGVRFDGPYGIDHFINGLANEVSRRMEKVGYRGTKLTLKVKQRKVGAKPPPKFLGHGSCHNLSKSIDLPGSTPTRMADVLAEAGMVLFREFDVPLDDVRGMGMIISKLSRNTSATKGKVLPSSGIASFFQGTSEATTTKGMASEVGEERKQFEDADALPLNPHSSRSPTPDLQSEDRTVEDPRTQGNSHAIVPLTQGHLALPPLSQICMSQVAALPPEMQDEIHTRLTNRDRARQQEGRDKKSRSSSNPVLVDLTRDVASTTESKACHPLVPPEKQSYRQIDLKRMLKLAAVKSGEESSRVVVDGISLTDFQALPLDIQLQIANGDHGSLGIMSSKRPQHNWSTSNGVRSTAGPSKAPLRSSTKIVAKQSGRITNEDSKIAAVDDSSSSVYVSPVAIDIFDDDIVPLNQFLDDNSPSNPEAMEMIHSFFRTCLVERRMNALRPLFRSIINRNDDPWNRENVLMEIGEALSDAHFELYRRRLDVDWLVKHKPSPD